jgi:hypothetical protein
MRKPPQFTALNDIAPSALRNTITRLAAGPLYRGITRTVVPLRSSTCSWYGPGGACRRW